MIKKALIAITICAALFYVPPAQAASVFVHDEYLESDQPAFIENGRTFVPMRAIFEKLGAQVNWDASNGTVSAQRGEKFVTIDKPKIINGRTMVPLRYVSEALGSKVDWSQELQTAYVDSTPPKVYARMVYSPQSLKNPANWRLSVYDWGENERLVISKYQTHDNQFIHFQPQYELTLFKKDGSLWREQIGMGAFITCDSSGNWRGVGMPQMLLAAPSLDPEIRKFKYSTEPNLYANNPRQDFLIDFSDTGLYMRLDKSMAPGIGSTPEPPLMQDGIPNPPTGIFVPLVR